MKIKVIAFLALLVFSFTTVRAQEEDLSGLYTVQLAAFKDINTAKEFAGSLILPNDIAPGILEIYSSYDYWFILAAGVYETGGEAIRAANKICQDNNINGCWARSLEEVNRLSQLAKQSR